MTHIDLYYIAIFAVFKKKNYVKYSFIFGLVVSGLFVLQTTSCDNCVLGKSTSHCLTRSAFFFSNAFYDVCWQLKLTNVTFVYSNCIYFVNSTFVVFVLVLTNCSFLLSEKKIIN